MNNAQKEMIVLLEAMPLEEARQQIATGKFGDVGSPNHAFCLSWLTAKEATRSDALASEANRLSKWALWVSVFALLIAFGAFLNDVL